MTGYFVFCRIWNGFSDSFPWFEELNPLSDDELVEQLRIKTREWFRANKTGLRERYREKRKKVEEEMQHLGRCSVVRGVPTLGPFKQREIAEVFNLFDHDTLIRLCADNDLQLAGTDEELRRRFLAFYEEDYQKREIERQRAQRRRDMEWAKHRNRPNIRLLLRGKRKGFPFEIRVARLAGWFFENTNQFGGISPTPKLMLVREESKSRAAQILNAAKARFSLPEWTIMPLRFGLLSCKNLTPVDLTTIEFEQNGYLDPDSHWTGTPWFRAVHSEFARVFDTLQKVNGASSRDSDADTVFVPTPFQERILSSLDGTALRTDAIASAIDCNRRQIFKPNGIKELVAAGRVRWHHKLGYFRPDSLPQELSSTTS